MKCKHKRLKDVVKLEDSYIQYCEKCNKIINILKEEDVCTHDFEKLDKIEKEYVPSFKDDWFTFRYSTVLHEEIIILKCRKCGKIETAGEK